MDIFSVALEQSNIQCSLQACNLGEAQTASLISADSGLKGQRSIGTITQTDIAKTEFRKIRKQWLWDIFYLEEAVFETSKIYVTFLLIIFVFDG